MLLKLNDIKICFILSKRTQLNVNIDQKLMKALKTTALEKDLKLGQLVNDLLYKSIDNLDAENKIKFSEQDALNCTHFMYALFVNKFQKDMFSNKKDAFDQLLKFIETNSQWTEYHSTRLKNILLLNETSQPWTAAELNAITKERECECPIYMGLKQWINIKVFPSQDLICDLGASLVPLIAKNI